MQSWAKRASYFNDWRDRANSRAVLAPTNFFKSGHGASYRDPAVAAVDSENDFVNRGSLSLPIDFPGRVVESVPANRRAGKSPASGTANSRPRTWLGFSCAVAAGVHARLKNNRQFENHWHETSDQAGPNKFQAASFSYSVDGASSNRRKAPDSTSWCGSLTAEPSARGDATHLLMRSRDPELRDGSHSRPRQQIPTAAR